MWWLRCCEPAWDFWGTYHLQHRKGRLFYTCEVPKAARITSNLCKIAFRIGVFTHLLYSFPSLQEELKLICFTDHWNGTVNLKRSRYGERDVKRWSHLDHFMGHQWENETMTPWPKLHYVYWSAEVSLQWSNPSLWIPCASPRNGMIDRGPKIDTWCPTTLMVIFFPSFSRDHSTAKNISGLLPSTWGDTATLDTPALTLAK